MARYDVSDEGRQAAKPLLPRPGKGGRRLVNGIFYVLRTGAP